MQAVTGRLWVFNPSPRSLPFERHVHPIAISQVDRLPESVWWTNEPRPNLGGPLRRPQSAAALGPGQTLSPAHSEISCENDHSPTRPSGAAVRAIALPAFSRGEAP